MVQINELLGNKSLMKILNFFLKHPTTRIYQYDLKKKVKLAKGTLLNNLEILINLDILNVEKFGRAKVYSLNKSVTLVKYLKILQNIMEFSGISKISQRYKVKMYLYGSAARGEDHEESDMDILVIGQVKREEIITDIKKIEGITSRPITIQTFSQLEWSAMAKKDPAFYERVEKDKIEL